MSHSHRLRTHSWRPGRLQLSPAEISAIAEALTSQLGMDEAEKLAYRAQLAHPFSTKNRAAYIRRHCIPWLGVRRNTIELDRLDSPLLNFLRRRSHG